MSNLVSYTGDTITYRIPVTNDGPHPNTNVKVDSFVISGGQTYTGFSTNKGTFDSGTMLWTIGDMTGYQEVWLELYYEVTDINLAPFTLTATVSGDINNNTTDDDISLSVASTTAPPAAGGNDSTGHGGYVNVSENDTQCTNGTTEWRIKPGTVNGTQVSWDELTGEGVFKFDDFTQDITGTYDLFCVVGVDEFFMGTYNFTIPCLLADIVMFNHTLESVQYDDLSVDEKITLQNQWPDITAEDFCWHVLKSADGTVTSGLPLHCGENIDTKVTVETVVADIDTGSPGTGVTLPTDPQDGDVHTAVFNNGVAYFEYDKDGTTWNVKGATEFGNSFSGAYADLTGRPILNPSSGNVTGTINLNTGVFTLTAPTPFSGAYNDLTGRPTITASGGNVKGTLNLDTGVLTLTSPTPFSGDYDDLTNRPTITASDGNVTGTLNLDTGVLTLTAPAGGGADNWGTQVIEHDGASLSSGDGTVGDPLLVAVTAADVGLGNVDNTSDVNKPVSIAQGLAIATKQDLLISATNIKTVNGNSLLGSGDLTISGGDSVSLDSQRFVGAIGGAGVAADLILPFPKPTQAAGNNLKSVAIYASSITGDFGARLETLSGALVSSLVYSQATGGVQTFTIDDVSANGYQVILSEAAVNTSSTTLIGVSLYYAPGTP